MRKVNAITKHLNDIVLFAIENKCESAEDFLNAWDKLEPTPYKNEVTECKKK